MKDIYEVGQATSHLLIEHGLPLVRLSRSVPSDMLRRMRVVYNRFRRVAVKYGDFNRLLPPPFNLAPTGWADLREKVGRVATLSGVTEGSIHRAVLNDGRWSDRFVRYIEQESDFASQMANRLDVLRAGVGAQRQYLTPATRVSLVRLVVPLWLHDVTLKDRLLGVLGSEMFQRLVPRLPPDIAYTLARLCYHYPDARVSDLMSGTLALHSFEFATGQAPRVTKRDLLHEQLLSRSARAPDPYGIETILASGAASRRVVFGEEFDAENGDVMDNEGGDLGNV